MYTTHISSVVCGVLLGLSLQSTSVCSIGFIMTQITVLWLRWCWHQVHMCMFSTDTLTYAAQNSDLYAHAACSSEPRLGATNALRTTHCAVLACVSGICDTMSLVLGKSTADAHALLLAAFLLAGNKLRFIVASFMLYVYTVLPVPMVHDIVRPTVTIMATVLASSCLPRRWTMVQLFSSSAIALAIGSTECPNKLTSLSPALVLSVALYDIRANPVVLLNTAVIVLILQ